MNRMTAMLSVLPAALAFLPSAAVPTQALAATACENLAKLALPNAKIDVAQSAPAGDLSFDVKRPGTKPQNFKNLPAFCRVAATLRPSSDSDIKTEVWLPANWNGKLVAYGNGNWAGAISYAAMAGGLRKGYAVTSTDTGHAAISTDGSWSFGHPEKMVDFGWRSEHEMTEKAKAIVTAFYGNAAKRAYWSGCSTGGRQGLMAATRFPDDFDGIVASTPSNPRANRNGWQLWATQMAHKTPDSPIDEDKLKVLHQAAVKACDAIDGVRDGLIDNPKLCKFDPAVALCKAGQDKASCLSPAQVATAKALYSPGRFSNGQEYHPGLEPGSEIGWEALTATEPEVQAAVNYSLTVHKDPKWDWKTFNADTDVPLAQKTDVYPVDVTSTDVSKFLAHKGKMIMSHGWADPSVTPNRTVNYYNSVLKTTPNAADSVRLFMVPSMGHCGGGDGPNSFDLVTALDQWVEKGIAPQQVLASRIQGGKVVRTRPLCPYPQVARYKGTGSIDEAANFVCRAP
jgi:feruloyl esterase